MLDGIFDSIQNLINGSGFGLQYWQNYLMILIACFLLFLAISKKYEPLLLLPIAFGMILANLPLAGMMGMPTNEMIAIPVDELIQATGKTLDEIRQTFSADQINDVLNALHPEDTHSYPIVWQAVQDQMLPFWNKPAQNGGLLYYLYQGVKLGIYPPLIFLGIGAMTDFGPLIANPRASCWVQPRSSVSLSPSLVRFFSRSPTTKRLPSPSSAARTARPPSMLPQSSLLTCSARSL